MGPLSLLWFANAEGLFGGDCGGEYGRFCGERSGGSSSGEGGSLDSGLFGRTKLLRVACGETEPLSSVQSSSWSSSSSPTSKLGCPLTGLSSVPFLRKLFLVCAFSDFD